MNDEARQRLTAELERLKRDYLVRLRDSRAELEQLHAACGGGDEAACARVHSLAHGLAGTAGSYGFMEISQAATAVDLLCKDRATGAEIAAGLALLIDELG